MPDIYKIATLHINGLVSKTRTAMLEDFIRKQEIDVILLQEVTQHILNNIRRFAAYTSIGTSGRGTAILTRERMPLTNIVRLPTGRGMATEIQGVWLVNLYAPSGAERRQERGLFHHRPSTLAVGHPDNDDSGRGFQLCPRQKGRYGTFQLQSRIE
jgi:exonuclease III